MKNCLVRSPRHLLSKPRFPLYKINHMVRMTSPTLVVALTVLAHTFSASSAFVPPTLLPQQQRPFSMFSSSDDSYATPDEIQDLLKNDRTVVLDVRRADEIQATGYLQTPSNAWVTIPCTPTDATLLQMTAPNLLRDKTAPVLVHCAAGKRAAKAKQVLEDMGYECVVNAGGFAALQPFVAK